MDASGLQRQCGTREPVLLRVDIKEEVRVGRDVVGNATGIARLECPHRREALAGDDLIPDGWVLDTDDLELPPAAMHHINDVAVRGQGDILKA